MEETNTAIPIKYQISVGHRLLDMIEGTGKDLWAFIREKFEVLILGAFFLFIFVQWARSDYMSEVKEVLMLVLTAFVALMRIVPRGTTNISTDVVKTENVETAKTESGDINLGQPDPKASEEVKPGEIRPGE